VAVPNPQHTTSLSLTLTQDLLRNFGIGVNRTNITIAEKNWGIAREAFRDTLIQTLFEVESAYWDLYFAEADLKVRQMQLGRAEKLVQRAEAQVKVGEAASAGGWSTPASLSEAGSSGSWPQIGADAAGNLYALYAVPLNEGRGIYFARSEDGGATWSESRQVFDAAAQGWAMVDHPVLLVLPEGTLPRCVEACPSGCLNFGDTRRPSLFNDLSGSLAVIHKNRKRFGRNYPRAGHRRGRIQSCNRGIPEDAPLRD
jgi:hypothetical protein